MANSITVGKVEVTSLSDGSLEFDLCNFYPSLPEEDWKPYHEYLTADHRVHLELASYLVRSDGRTILVDTGMGPPPDDMPDATWGELVRNLEALGVQPGDVDTVVMTHAHRDHVGWNTTTNSGTHKPTFPNARHYVSSTDWEACHREDMRERFPNAPERVWPLEELGLLELMPGEHALTNELTVVPTPGHTPGHVSIEISSQGERAIILGDILHNEAQVHETDWVSRADTYVEMTRSTRRSLMERLEAEGTLAAAGHLPAPGFGRISRRNGRRIWQPL